MTIIEMATQLAAPWAKVYSHSAALSTSVTFVHIGGILLGGGCAVAADRMTLRVLRADSTRRADHLSELHAVHRPVLIGLTITFLSGFLLLAADVEKLATAPTFWIKMGIVALLLVNGFVMNRAEGALRKGTDRPLMAWSRLKVASWASLGLWFGSVFLGTALLAA